MHAGLARLRAEDTTALYDAVVFSLYHFQGIRGQKALILVSDGKDTDSKFSFDQVMDYARRAAVPIYAIGISISFLGLGMRVLLAIVCILRLGSNIVPICRPLFGVFFMTAWLLSIQTLIHNEPMTDPFLRAFVPWIFGLIVAKALMTRPGFLRRAAIAMFAMGASLVPFLKINTALERARIELAGGLGLIVPAATRIAPWLTPLAALGLGTIMILAILFHLVRDEASVVWIQALLAGLALFVAWGRWRKASITRR